MAKEITIGTPQAAGMIEWNALNGQIQTAKAYPRDLRWFLETSLYMVGLNDIAPECLYAFTRGGKLIEGPSTRLAEIIASNFGNCRVSGSLIDETDTHVVARGIFHDLEANLAVSIEIQRKIVGNSGRFNADMIGVTGNAAIAIATRNAILRGIPKPLWLPVYDKAYDLAKGKPDDLPKLRQSAIDYCAGHGISAAQVLSFAGRNAVEHLTADDLARLRGALNAIREGEANMAEMFPPIVPPGPQAEPKPAPPVERGRVKDKTATPAPRFDDQEEKEWISDFDARLSQCPTLADVNFLATEYAVQTKPRLSARGMAEAEALLEKAQASCLVSEREPGQEG